MKRDRVIDDDWRALTATQGDVLVVVGVIGPSSGAEIAAEIPDLHPNTVYPTLSTLREMGYIGTEHRGEETDDKSNGLTVDGQALLQRAYLKPAREIDHMDKHYD